MIEDEEKEGVCCPKRFTNTQKYIGIPLVFLLVVFGILLIFNHAEIIKIFQEDVCGDGTSEGECSHHKPYFCEDEILVEKASVCGCPPIMSVSDDGCDSDYKNNSKEISLNYLLKGEEHYLNLILYQDMEDYISELPRSVNGNSSKNLSRVEFKLKNIDNENQKYFLIPLVVNIQNLAKDRDDQVRIATSIVQNIPYGHSNETYKFGPYELNHSRYLYDVLWDNEGICGEKSDLLAFLLKNLGFETTIFYYQSENHESTGIKCPQEYSVNESGYCFIETTGSAIISDYKIEYVGGITLNSEPEIMFISNGFALGDNLEEYEDAQEIMKLRKKMGENGGLGVTEVSKWNSLHEKYNLDEVYNSD